LLGFLSSLTRSAYRSVFKVCSDELEEGEKFPIMTVLQLPTKESLRTSVNLLPLKGVWFLFWSKALMHSFRASNDLLISAPSNRVYLFWSMTSAPLSLPAKSMKDNLPSIIIYTVPWTLLWSLIEIWRIAWDLDESLFELFEAVTRTELPYSITFIIYSTDWTFLSWSPTMLTFPLASSLGWRRDLSFSKSNNFPQYIS